MKKTFKVTTLVLALFVCILGTSVVAYAGESFDSFNVSTNWRTIASDTEGFGCNVKITGQLSTGGRIDVRMLGKDGKTELWSQNSSCPDLGSRVYRCGSDVYYIQVKVSSSNYRGVVYALKTDEPAD